MTDAIDPRRRDLGAAVEPFVIAVQSARVPVILIALTESGCRVTLANASFFSMTGLGHSEVLGKSVASVFSPISTALSVKALMTRLTAGQASTWEMNCRRADGTSYLSSLILHPLRDPAAAVRQYILSFYIFDDRVEPSRNKAPETRVLYKHAPGFIATSEGPEHRITFANDSYKQFVGHKKLEGLTVAEAMPEIAEQGFVAILDRVFQTGVPYRGETVPFDLSTGKGGETVRRYADFVYEPIRDAGFDIIGIFCEGYDVTDKLEAEATLRTLQNEMAHTSRVNAMGTMATTLAHELNQPLAAISSYAAGCLRLVDPTDRNSKQIEQALNAIEVAAKRAGAIIRTLRDLTDRRVRAVELFELKTVVDESVNLTRTACSLETEIIADIPPNLSLHADRIQIQQVLINLLRNGCDAVVHSPAKKIIVSALAGPEEVVLSVRDTGPGVSSEAAQGIFTWSDTAKEGGMGLGLSISRTIVESHGGRIWLEHSSEAGSEFRFSIPARIIDPD